MKQFATFLAILFLAPLTSALAQPQTSASPSVIGPMTAHGLVVTWAPARGLPLEPGLVSRCQAPYSILNGSRTRLIRMGSDG